MNKAEILLEYDRRDGRANRKYRGLTPDVALKWFGTWMGNCPPEDVYFARITLSCDDQTVIAEYRAEPGQTSARRLTRMTPDK